MKTLDVRRSRVAEAFRQAAAAATHDVVMCLRDSGVELDPTLRQLFLDNIHLKMIETAIELVEEAGWTFQDG